MRLEPGSRIDITTQRHVMVRFFPSLLCLLSAATLAQAETPDASNRWPQWRGPDRDCRVAKSAWQTSLDETTLRKSWSVPLGPSYSGPIVTEDAVFVTETRDRSHEVVRALDRKNGQELWATEWAGSISVPFFAKANGDWIRSTPAVDGDRLYVAGIRDVLVCLNTKDGSKLWEVDFTKSMKTKVPSFGCVCSPLVDGDHVYMQAGGGFAKLDKLTGKVVWRALVDGGGMFGSAFSSPTIAKVAGKRQILVQTRQKLAGVDLDSGKELWSMPVKAFRGMNILTPIVTGDIVFTSCYGGGTFGFRVTQQDGKFSAKQAWNTTVQAYMSSPVLIDGKVYLHLRNQRMTCINPQDGEQLWSSRPYGKYWSSVFNGRQILALDERGDLLLIDASPDEFKLVGSRHISDQSTWAHLAVVGNEVFVRELKSMTVFNWGDKKFANK